MRPTDEQIDREIVDAAAGLFATHGLARTSVQQVADAVGYSKTGLLHRFGTKEALHAAAVEAITTTVDAVLDEAEAKPKGEERAVFLVDRITGIALDNPGLVQLFFETTRPQNIDAAPAPLAARIERFQQTLDSQSSSPEQRLRTGLGFYLIVNAALLPDAGLSRDERTSLVADLARSIVIAQ